LVANYSGDPNFNVNSTPVKFDTEGLSNYTIKVNVTPGKYGENTTITVILPEGADGNLTVTVGNETYPVTINPDGTGTVEVPSVVGPNEVKVTYENSTRYAPQNATATYTVDPQDEYPLEMEITPGKYGENTTIAITAPEDVKQVNVTVDGVTYTVDLTDGKGNLTLDNLTAGKHEIETSFAGNENYTENSNKTTFDVPQTTPTIKVDVNENNTAGSDVVVNVEIDKNATGSVNIIVDGQDHVVPIVDGKAQYTIEGAQPGEHNITVTYPGDINYTAATPAEAHFNVDTFETAMEILTPEIDDDNNVTVVVKVNKTATGNVTVKVGDKTYNGTVDPETGIVKVNVGVLPAGDNEITVTYDGDKNFNATSVTDTIKVPSLVNYDMPVTSNDIKYGEVAQVNVTLPDGAKVDNLKFYVDGVENANYTVNGNVVTLNVAGLGAGDHTVEVDYADDGTYANRTNSTTFNVAKVEPGIKEFNVTEPINVGEAVNVTVKLPADANGTITVDVNGTKYVADVINGEATLSIPNLGNGTHVLNITYSGDGNYDPINVVKEVEVNKVVPQIAANTTDIKFGENAVFDVTVPDDATGTVTVKVGDVEQTVAVTGGVNHIIVPGIPVGENQEVTVTYNGDAKYAPNATTTTLTVSQKPTSPDDIKVIDNGDGTVTVIVPDNATGNVTVQIGDEVLPAEALKDGKAVINLTNSSAKPGKHNITVSYSGDENHTAVQVNAAGEIPKWNSDVNATVSAIREGDNAVITVEVSPKDATGKVIVEVNGTAYAADIQDGKAVVTVPGLKEGTHNITVTYGGDENYNGATCDTQIKVQEPITVEVTGTGEDTQAVIHLPEGATQNVTAYIDGNEVPVEFDQAGNPTVDLSGLMPGEHNMTIVYVDENNVTSVVNTTIIVPKWPSSVEATAPMIREGDVLPITVKVGSAEMTGLVLVDLNGTGYYANLTNGRAMIYAPGLTEGFYDANVTYLGDEKYEVSSNTFWVIVEAPITITVEGAGNSTKVIVDLPEGGTNDVKVLVDGVEVPATVEDGKAVVNLNDISAGDHDVTVVYTDQYGTQSVVNQTIVVYNSIKANDMKRGWNSPYDFEAEFLDKDGHVIANTVMEFKVNGKTYKVKTDNKGIAKLSASHLAVGKYKVQITNTVTHEVMTKSVTIVKRIIKNKDVTMDFADGTYFTVTVIGDDGKPVGKGEVVGFSVNNRQYVAITDSKGVAKLQINLNPANYKIVSEYAKYKVSNKLVVKQTLKLVKKTITVKKSAKKLVLKAKLKWTNGKPIKGKQIVFKFYGKTYKVKTNSKGLAKVTIKKNIIQKIKKGKKYAYSAAYKTNVVKGKVKGK
jgi:hypothetical protein